MIKTKSRLIVSAVVSMHLLRLVCLTVVFAGLMFQSIVPILPRNSALAKESGARKSLTQPIANSSINERAHNALASLPLSFEANRGQANSRVKFLSRANGFSLALTSSEAVFQLAKTSPKQPKKELSREMPPKSTKKPTTLLMRLLGANADAKVEGLDPLPAKTNYFIGNDPKKWRTNISNFARARFHNVYPGVDIAYYGNQGQLEYDFVVAAGQTRTEFGLSSKVLIMSPWIPRAI